jgi:hypothetical protein
VPPRATPNRPGSIPANAAIQRLNPDWVFVGHSTLDHVIREEFGITGSNREPAREQEILAEFNARRLDLGGNNYAMGVSSSLGPEPSKFRALAELLSSACGVAMRDPSVRSRFFPEVNHSDILVNSASAYDVAFLRLLGRYPEAAERGILVSMVNDLRAQGVSLESQLMGVCAVILRRARFRASYSALYLSQVATTIRCEAVDFPVARIVRGRI